MILGIFFKLGKTFKIFLNTPLTYYQSLIYDYLSVKAKFYFGAVSGAFMKPKGQQIHIQGNAMQPWLGCNGVVLSFVATTTPKPESTYLGSLRSSVVRGSEYRSTSLISRFLDLDNRKQQ